MTAHWWMASPRTASTSRCCSRLVIGMLMKHRELDTGPNAAFRRASRSCSCCSWAEHAAGDGHRAARKRGGGGRIGHRRTADDMMWGILLLHRQAVSALSNPESFPCCLSSSTATGNLSERLAPSR